MIDEKKLKKEHEKRKKPPLNKQLKNNIMLVHCSFLLATFKILYLQQYFILFYFIFENDEIKLKELKLKKKRKQIELQNAINEKKTFDFYNANLEKAKELMGKFVLKNYRLKSQLLRLFLIIVCSEEFKIFISNWFKCF